MGLELKKGRKIQTHSSFSCVFYVALLNWHSKKIVAFHFAHPMTQKSLNLVKEWKKIGKCLMIGICLPMDDFALLP
jgi:hypothetical protein